MLGKEEDEWKGAKECVILAIENIAEGGAEVAKGLYENPGLMESLEKSKENW